MRWPLASRARLDAANAALVRATEVAAQHRAHCDMQQHNLDEMRRMYDELLKNYHGLRLEGQVAPWSSPESKESFGPLTRAALHDMGVGQSGILKRAMSAKAELIWLQNSGAQQDELTAIAVRNGEGAR